MSRKLVSFDAMERLLGAPDPQDAPNDNRTRLTSAKRALRLGVEQELTGRQRTCVELYYFQGLTQEQIAQRLGVGKPTVCRHLQKARARLETVIRYSLFSPKPEE